MGPCFVEGKEQLKKRAVGSVDGTQEPARREKACQKGNPQLQRKVHAFLRCDKGVKVSIAQELGRENLGSKNATELSAEVKIAQESLKSSFLELQACVKDPLPEALNIFDIGSKLAQKGTNQEQPIQNKGGDVDVSSSNTCRDIVLFQTKDVDHKKSSIQRPNLIVMRFLIGPKNKIKCCKSKCEFISQFSIDSKIFKDVWLNCCDVNWARTQTLS
ncbi:uncharacterized protein LOC130955340 [Arachis stenosperma]|uniref:uncharacterized protein LOC130955340 n=1 Tax=Arachis stenosperma TaxID=217475 RepID=UPI0025ACF65B|nr:uncharacterized protein LOC130955340 [Arachis stenosperma]